MSATSEAAIRQLIERREFHVVFQPILELSTGHVFAYEALARCDSPDFDGPTSMFAAAVTHGCVGELGRCVRELAVARCTDHPLFLNVHPVELHDQWLVRLDDPISSHGHSVYLEITESTPLACAPLTSAVLAELRARGVALVVDDLGAGYSNLKYVADLEPRVVKLDRILVAGLAVNTRTFQLVRGIVRMCHDMSCLVVAEGVETLDELHAARTAGVDLVQGYLLARPSFPLPDAVMPAPVALSDRPTLQSTLRAGAMALRASTNIG